MTARRPTRAPDFRTSRIWPRRSWLFPLVCALLDMATGTRATECCPGGAIWLGSAKNCSDGTEIRLTCVNGFYRVDPSVNHFDEFTVVAGPGGPQLEFQHDYEPILANRFCVSGEKEDERWALVCFDNDEYGISRWRYGVFGMLSIISALFLVLTLVVYIVLPELRDIQDKSMASSVAFLASSYLLLGIEQMRPHDVEINEDILCLPLAFLLYWSFLSAFFWMNLVAFNVWRTVWFKSFPIKDADLFLIFCGIGLVGPGILLLAALATHHTPGYHLKPHFGETSCWFEGTTETWAFFYGPISSLLILNLIYLGLTCWRLWYDYRSYNGSGLRALRFNCLLYVKLILVMGITWIFEVISFASSLNGDSVYWLATDVLNDIQGVIIFILLVPMRRRVKKLLARRRPFGIRFPKSWAAYDEDDEVNYALPVEVELSNP
ncbi:G-protein coupled receptor Mth2-like isoform X2 [Venturia canescens]|uniref:G-protein coupled receptor Mth2-like isoform X2 n=1 Tax=Venturia canescens TaxID=32260 RepID=UPI001C9C7DB4|nr:G-protein coupled receptor Mth2-like isoform X2 [Venturia canescens]